MTTTGTTISGTPTFGNTATAGSSTSTTKKTDTSTASGQQELFLNMLVEQMKNQDPTSPMDSKDMMSQMSQMTSTEQLTNMASSLTSMQNTESLAQGVSMIGTQVTYLGSDNSVNTGTVASVAQAKGNKAQLVLSDGSKVDLSSITAVRYAGIGGGSDDEKAGPG